ncbi:UNVERIFIED_CONTAM: hypothetical protein Sindi_2277300 [Sesamum indicum]
MIRDGLSLYSDLCEGWSKRKEHAYDTRVVPNRHTLRGLACKQMPTFFSSMAVIIMKTAELVGLGTLGLLSPRTRAGVQAFSFDRHKDLGNRHRERSVNGMDPVEGCLLVPKFGVGLLKGASSLASFLFSARLFFLAAWASSMLIYLAPRAKRASNFETEFLARDLKSSSKIPCEKALAFTSCVAEVTSKAAVMNLCRGQLVKPLFCGPGKGSDENLTLDPVRIPVQESYIRKMRKVFLEVSQPITLSNSRGAATCKELARHHSVCEGDTLLFFSCNSHYLVLLVLDAFLKALQSGQPLLRNLLGSCWREHFYHGRWGPSHSDAFF